MSADRNIADLVKEIPFAETATSFHRTNGWRRDDAAKKKIRIEIKKGEITLAMLVFLS
jgi:hypothetical protein